MWICYAPIIHMNWKTTWDFFDLIFKYIVDELRELEYEALWTTNKIRYKEICYFYMVSKLALVQIASIDDTLIWCKNISTIMLYLECNCKIFQKYRVSFRLNECRFLEERVEYVCHNLTSEVNYPACGIFDLIHV